MIQTPCAICGSYKDYKILYKKNFSEKDLTAAVFSARRLPDGSHYQIVKCNKDGLVRSDPIFEEEKISRLYKESKLTYEEEVKNLEKTYLEALNYVLPVISKEDNILEIGCGNGFILSELYHKGYKRCFGIEPSRDAVKKANKDIKGNIVTDILRPGVFKLKKFKLIFFFQTLDHVPNPNQFLKECYKLLEKGGFILAFNHNIDSLSSKLMGEKSPIIDIEHTFLYSPQTNQMLFKKNKFSPLKIYSPTSTISLKHLFWLFPLPKILKKRFISKSIFKKINVRLKLGNLCIIAQKQ